jgi:hypothetical protein
VILSLVLCPSLLSSLFLSFRMLRHYLCSTDLYSSAMNDASQNEMLFLARMQPVDTTRSRSTIHGCGQFCLVFGSVRPLTSWVRT